jgi:DNA-binding transcriptional ArsR family regulator
MSDSSPIPALADQNNITDAFSALSHEVRLRIVHQLLIQRLEHDGEPERDHVQDDPRWVLFKNLRADLDLGQSTLSYHLEKLADGRLIRRKTAGRCTYLTANPERMREMARFLMQGGVEERTSKKNVLSAVDS